MTSRRDYKRSAAHTANAAVSPAGRLRFIAGLIFGLALGLGAAFGVHLYYQQMLYSADEPVEAEASPGADEKDDDMLDYDFFTLLPDFKLVIPEPGGAAPSGEPKLGKYILQAGAFRTRARADGQKQKLTDMGYRAEVQLFRADGADWHRVWLGPYSRLARADAARRTLKEQGIETLLTEH